MNNTERRKRMRDTFENSEDSSVSSVKKKRTPFVMKGIFVWDRDYIGPESRRNISDFDLMMYQELLCAYYLNESPLPRNLGNLMNLIEGRVSCIYGKHTLTEYRRLLRVLSLFFVETENGYVPRYPHSRFINPETDNQEGGS